MCIRDRYQRRVHGTHKKKKVREQARERNKQTKKAEIEQMENQIYDLPKTESVNLDHFVLLTVIGKGSYAKVVLVRKKDTGEVHAMKVLKKDHIQKKKQIDHIQTERNVLVGINHPFVVRLHYAFQNERKLFFVLEYCPGGELFNLLQRKKVFHEDQAKFYAAQMVLAIEHLHSKDIVYRDLKPENVLLDAEGYIRITDFGLSKQGIKDNKGAMSVCGTPEYLAPEILFKMGHGKAVDWWTLGAIIFEMLTGLPPFYTTDRNELFERIKFGTLRYPKHLSPAARNLLEGLFIKEPNKRLGGGPDNGKPIKEHPWFAGVNWQALLNKEIKAPFIPVVKSELDVSNFDPEFTETPLDSYKESYMSTEFQNYDNFTWNGEASLQKIADKNAMETEQLEFVRIYQIHFKKEQTG
eukprot:TRINITY_DN2562_c0_g1_i2.p1 TRINITY_DN2562_c0_g1~~TRINITY_DN2562_c0_g1_i2.p1  ORF type:complete len:438 (-),score=141.84 TRINITY_DN2562_c0_g1_i2:293-1522(-)